MAQFLCLEKCQWEYVFNIHSVKNISWFYRRHSCQVPFEILHEIKKKKTQQNTTNNKKEQPPGLEILLQPVQGKLKILTQDL